MAGGDTVFRLANVFILIGTTTAGNNIIANINSTKGGRPANTLVSRTTSHLLLRIPIQACNNIKYKKVILSVANNKEIIKQEIGFDSKKVTFGDPEYYTNKQSDETKNNPYKPQRPR